MNISIPYGYGQLTASCAFSSWELLMPRKPEACWASPEQLIQAALEGPYRQPQA